MRKSECPVGTVAAMGNPANPSLIVKGEQGWRYINTGALIDDDDYHKAYWDVVTMPTESRKP